MKSFNEYINESNKTKFKVGDRVIANHDNHPWVGKIENKRGVVRGMSDDQYYNIIIEFDGRPSYHSPNNELDQGPFLWMRERDLILDDEPEDSNMEEWSEE